MGYLERTRRAILAVLADGRLSDKCMNYREKMGFM